MGVIFCVSSRYIDGLLEESVKFSFLLQGYTRFSDALIGLTKVNVSDIDGFVILEDKLSSKTDSFYKFVNLCNMISENRKKKLVIALKDSRNIDNVLSKVDISNLTVSVIDGFDEVTDTVITYKIYASIIAYNGNPFDTGILNNENKKKNKNNSKQYSSIKYKSLFSSVVLSLLDEPIKSINSDITTRQDILYQNIKTSEPILALIRQIQIKTMFEEVDADLESLVLKEIAKINDISKFTEYTSLLYLAKGGR